MGISGLGSLFQTQETEELLGIQHTRQGRASEDQWGSSVSRKTDSVTISAEGYRMLQAMRENSSSNNNEISSSNAENAGKTGASVTENGVLEGITARALPEDILASSAQNLAKIKEKGTKVLFEFSEDGSISIKPGLLREDYLRAQATLREWEIHEPGLGF